MKKLAIITTHPIQYYAPLFKLLSKRGRIAIKVFYTLGEGDTVNDRGFNKVITWDIPLLEEYPFEWADNTAVVPNTATFSGIRAPGLCKQVEDYQSDAVLIFGWANSAHLQAIRHFRKKVKLYFRGDSTLIDKRSVVKDLLRSAFLKRVYNGIDCAFFVGTNNKAYFKKYGFTDRRLSFAPHAIDNDRFAIAKDLESRQLRKLLDIDADDIMVLYAGKFEPVKNLGLLISAFHAIDRKAVKLVLVGSGGEETELKRLASEGAAKANIQFRDFINQSAMPTLYQAADLFCLPSKSETWGLAVNESLASGTAALVSSNVGCAIDLIKEGYNGSIFLSGSQDDLQRCLDKLTQSRKELIEMGQNAAKSITGWNLLNSAAAIEDRLLNETD